MAPLIDAALDLSGKTAGFALLCDGKVLRNATRPMRGRDSAEFAPWIQEELQQAGYTLDDVNRWTVGSGPGSFTGMRLAAALVAGWTFGKPQIQRRCVPTALGIAALANSLPGDKIGCLFDGRNRELIYFEVENRDGELFPTGETAVLNRDQAELYFTTHEMDHLICLAVEYPALELLLKPEVARRVQTVEAPDMAALACSGSKEFDHDLTDLVYIRPAVFV